MSTKFLQNIIRMALEDINDEKRDHGEDSEAFRRTTSKCMRWFDEHDFFKILVAADAHLKAEASKASPHPCQHCDMPDRTTQNC